MNNIVRYSIINEKFPREMVLLVGTGCKHKKCIFCDYFLDSADNPFLINKPILNNVSGIYGVLDVINSGSCFELDDKTLELIYIKAQKNNINTIWFESHFMYHKHLDVFRKKFSEINLKFRCGVETFNVSLRNLWKKGIPYNITPAKIAKYFDGVCLLVGVEGQSKEDIKNDIRIALNFFEYASVNIFTPNSTDVKPDYKLIEWFKNSVYPMIKDNPKLEILLNNTDLGVG